MKKKFSINDMTVKGKITMFSVVMLVFMVIIAGAGLLAANSVNTARKNSYDHYAMSEYYLSEAYSKFCNIQVSIRNIVFAYYNDSANLQDQENKIAGYKSEMQTYLTMYAANKKIFPDNIDNQFDKMTSYLTEWVTTMENEINLVKNGRQMLWKP